MGHPRLKCPRLHNGKEESTPSFIVYPNGWGTCFACNYRAQVDSTLLGTLEYDKEPEEDVAASIERIKQLPQKTIRGHLLHADDNSFYIVWPDGSYYKRRFNDDVPKRPKYLGAQAVKPPFILPGQGAIWRDLCFIVEGEMNALSLQASYPEYTVVSPGGTGEFFTEKYRKYLEVYLMHNRVVLVADDDGPGRDAVGKLWGKILAKDKSKEVVPILMEMDVNSVYVKQGREGVRQVIGPHLGHMENVSKSSVQQQESIVQALG